MVVQRSGNRCRKNVLHLNVPEQMLPRTRGRGQEQGREWKAEVWLRSPRWGQERLLSPQQQAEREKTKNQRNRHPLQTMDQSSRYLSRCYTSVHMHTQSMMQQQCKLQQHTTSVSFFETHLHPQLGRQRQRQRRRRQEEGGWQRDRRFRTDHAVNPTGWPENQSQSRNEQNCSKQQTLVVGAHWQRRGQWPMHRTRHQS